MAVSYMKLIRALLNFGDIIMSWDKLLYNYKVSWINYYTIRK